MGSTELVLYDLPSKQGEAWSPNTWKVRAILNYKKIPYQTEWVEFPDVEPKFKKLGLTPNPEGSWADYTVPVVRFPNGEYVMDSVAINKRLVAEYPEPAFDLEPELTQELRQIHTEAANPIFPAIMPRTRVQIIPQCSEEWFKKDRERRLGAPEEVYSKEQGGPEAWKNAEAGQKKLAAFIKKHKKDEGPFVRGSQITFPDVSIVSWCLFMKFNGDDFFEKFVKPVDGLQELYDAAQPYFARRD